MPGKRDPSQTTMTVSMSKRFLKSVDDVCARTLRGAPRAQIVRDALQDYLERKFGIRLPDDDVVAPSRLSSHRYEASVNEGSACEPLPERKPVVYEAQKRAKKKP